MISSIIRAISHSPALTLLTRNFSLLRIAQRGFAAAPPPQRRDRPGYEPGSDIPPSLAAQPTRGRGSGKRGRPRKNEPRGPSAARQQEEKKGPEARKEERKPEGRAEERKPEERKPEARSEERKGKGEGKTQERRGGRGRPGGPLSKSREQFEMPNDIDPLAEKKARRRESYKRGGKKNLGDITPLSGESIPPNDPASPKVPGKEPERK